MVSPSRSCTKSVNTASPVQVLKCTMRLKAKTSVPPPVHHFPGTALSSHDAGKIARTGGDAVAALQQTADATTSKPCIQTGRQFPGAEGTAWATPAAVGREQSRAVTSEGVFSAVTHNDQYAPSGNEETNPLTSLLWQ
jgi:hypothetical protein